MFGPIGTALTYVLEKSERSRAIEHPIRGQVVYVGVVDGTLDLIDCYENHIGSKQFWYG